MPTRTQHSPQERKTRSEAVRRLALQPLLRGSIVVMNRTCGTKSCHCQRGEKHRSLYLAVRSGDQRKLLYIPPALEAHVRQAIQTSHEVQQLVDNISQHCLEDFLRQKQELFASKRKGRKKQSP
jgi:hypothetical protein